MKKGLRLKVTIAVLLSLVFADVLGYVVARGQFERNEVEEVTQSAQDMADAISVRLDERMGGWSARMAAAGERLATEDAAVVVAELVTDDLARAVVFDRSGQRAVGAGTGEAIPYEDAYRASRSPSGLHADGDALLLALALQDGGVLAARPRPTIIADILTFHDPVHIDNAEGDIVLGTDEQHSGETAGSQHEARSSALNGLLIISVHIDRESALARAKGDAGSFLLTTSMAYVVAGVFISFVIAKTLDPLERITRAAQRMGRDETDLGLDVETGDEMEVLAHTLTDSARAISEARERERRDAHALRQASAEFELAVGQSASIAASARSADEVADALARSTAAVTGAPAMVLAEGTVAPASAAAPGTLAPRATLGTSGMVLHTSPDLDAASERKVRILAAQATIALARLRDAEDAARGEARHRAVLDALNEGVALLDAQGRVQYANAAARAQGLRNGHPVAAVVASQHADVVDALLARACEGEATASLDALDGRILDANARSILLEHKSGTLLVLQDVTDRVRLEREAEARRGALARSERLSALGTLVAGVAHEINNPLTYIQGNIEIALLDLEAPEHDATRSALSSALGGTLRIGEITRALKAVARQNEGAVDERVDLSVVARNVEALLRVGLSEGAELKFETSGQLFVRGSSTALHQVILNLAKNALEALPASGGLVTIRCDRQGNDAVAEVIDTGPGMSTQTLGKLFTPFFTTKTEGTGLGLSIVHGIVRDHRGSIDVASHPGEGTRFWVRFPLDASDQAPPTARMGAADVRAA